MLKIVTACYRYVSPVRTLFLAAIVLPLVMIVAMIGCEQKPGVPSKTLLESAEQGDAYNVRGHAYYGLDPVDIQDERGWTPLHYAAFRGHLHIVPILLSYEAPLEIRNNSGRTPLMEAIAGSQAGTATQLMRAGADHSVGDARGRTPLTIAVEAGDEALVKALLNNGADPELGNTRVSQSCLWIAVNAGRSSMVELLLKHGADPNAKADIPPGRYALHVAVFRQSESMVEMLLAAGARTDVTDNAGRTPINYAQDGASSSIREKVEAAAK